MTALDGQAAFQLVLDRAIQEGAEAKAQREQAQTAKGIIAAEQSLFRSKIDQCDRMERENKERLPKLQEFYAAAEAVLDSILDKSKPPSAAEERLRKAMRQVQGYCDPIPF